MSVSTVNTPSGRALGRIKDRPDPRDHFFAFKHPREAALVPPPKIDVTNRLPPAFDQGPIGSCGGNAGVGMMCHLTQKPAYSRLQLYFDTRSLEGTPNEDSGVECRDVMRALQLTGVASEILWPYDVAKFKTRPPEEIYAAAESNSIEQFSRLVTPGDYLRCLAAGFTFVLGIELFESFDGDDLARHGVVAMPDPKNEAIIGGHAVLVVGYDLNFKNTDTFKKSGVDAALIPDQMLKVRNSWGPEWGDAGHFWLPITYATNPSLGGDAWTGRLS